MRLGSLLLALLITAIPFVFSAHADPGWKMAGVRGGFSAISRYTYYHQYEAFAVYQLPWTWRSSGGWGVTPRIDGSAGMLHNHDADGFIGTVGPEFAFDKTGIPVELSGGTSFTFLSTPKFGRDSYEGDFQFTSHIGVGFRFSRWVGAGYRFQHMSNANLYGGNNPGLNMHMFSVNIYLQD